MWEKQFWKGIYSGKVRFKESIPMEAPSHRLLFTSLDCEQSLLLRSVEHIMDLASSKATSREKCGWGGNLSSFHQSFLVHFSNLHNFTVTLRGWSEENSMTHCLQSNMYLLARSSLSEPAITTTQSFSTAIFVPMLDKSAMEPLIMMKASSMVITDLRGICCSSSNKIRSKPPQTITATFWMTSETRATKTKHGVQKSKSAQWTIKKKTSYCTYILRISGW